MEMFSLLGRCIPGDHSRQVSTYYYLEHIYSQGHKVRRVLDLGCGAGDSVDYFRRQDPSVIWIGLDIEDSPEVNLRIRTDAQFQTFDGIHIPFKANYFDLVYSNQVFEHVRYPERLLKEVERVLVPKGHFVGSTSHLEPCHSYSLWNFTPYGFRLVIEEAGLELVEVRPSIDALSLIIRYGLARPKFCSRWWARESPLNKIISLYGAVAHKPHVFVNAVKLLFCGQFCFFARKVKSS